MNELIAFCLREDIDLIVTGRRGKGRRIETLPARLAREAPCPVLMVPDGSRVRLRRILVPIDYSPQAARAVEVAWDLAQGTGQKEIRGLHVYSLPPGVEHAGDAPKEFGELMRSYSVQAFERFRTRRLAGGVEIAMDYVLDAHPAEALHRVAVTEQVDLIVMGARGGSSPHWGTLGRVASRVLHISTVPVLLTRRGR